MCKRVFRFEFNEAVIDKISNFHKIAPNFTYIHKNNFKYNWNFLDQLLIYKFYGRDM